MKVTHMHIQQASVNVLGIRLNYQFAGAFQLPPILLIHGVGASSNYVRELSTDFRI
jgi:pimeloyl-ACP methyl ester carboxylesterase